MAIVWADFPSGQQGLYGSNRDLMLNGVWAAFEGLIGASGVSLENDPDPSVGSTGRVLRVLTTSSGVTGPRFALPLGETQQVGVGFRLWCAGLPPANWQSRAPLFSFRTLANTQVVNFSVLSNGAIAAAQNVNGTTPFGQSVIPVITANAWNHVEIRVLRSATVGEIEVRVNGRVIPGLDLDTLNLGTNDIAQILLGSTGVVNPTNTFATFYKDLVIWDGSGSTGNNFQGSVSVRDLIPDGDDDFQWIPSTGTAGFNLINSEVNPDTTFITAEDPPPSPSIFTLTNLPDDVTSVRALLPISRSRKTDGGDCNLEVSLSPEGTNWDVGADNPLTTAYTYRWDVSEKSPTTTAPWTPIEVNNALVRVERTQ